MRSGILTSTAPALRGGAAILINAVLGCALLYACGGGQKAQPATALAAAKPEPPPPPLPDNPLRLLPAGAQGVLVAVMPELRGNALFDKIKQWAVRTGCLDEARAAWLLERTERIVLASYAAPGDAKPAEKAPALAVFHGKYVEDDVRSALAQGRDWLGAPDAPVQERMRGRFRVITSGEIAGVALSSELLAFGRTADLDGLLDVADGKRPAWLAGGAATHGIDREKWLSNVHSLSLFAQLDEFLERRLHRVLSNVGAGAATDGLGQSTAAFGVKLGDGARAQLEIAYPGSAAATHAASELRSLLEQASLIIRLAGLPRLDRAEVTSDQALLSISLALSASEVQQLSDPLLAALDGEGPACAARATAEK